MLWIVVLLGLVASAVVREYRRDLDLTRNTMMLARAEALAQAGIVYAAYELLHEASGGSWRSDGTPYELVLDGETVRVEIEDEGGKLDVNRTDPGSLSALVEAVVAEPLVAARIVEGLLSLRAAQPLVSLRDTLQVPGVTASVLADLRPLATVHTGRRDIDPQAAAPALLAVLRGLDDEQLSAFLDARDRRAAIAPYRSRSGFFSITASVTTSQGAVVVREAVVQLVPDEPELFRRVEVRRVWE